MGKKKQLRIMEEGDDYATANSPASAYTRVPMPWTAAQQAAPGIVQGSTTQILTGPCHVPSVIVVRVPNVL